MSTPFSTALFTRPLSEVDASDVEALLRAELPEGESIEFKERLSTKGGAPDVWEIGGERIGDKARDALLHQVIAFANARGGHVILGVAESDDHPKRAIGLWPVRGCADLADRIQKQVRDLIEPPLPTFETRGIPLDTDGAGIVILRVPASRSAPHRHRESRRAVIRRADRTEELSMRDIQELTLQRAAEASRAETMLTSRAAAFATTLDRMASNPDLRSHFAVRVTVAPALEEISLPREWIRRTLPYVQSFTAGSERQVYEVSLPCLAFNSRPILRGQHFFTDFVGQGSLQVEILETGLVEYQLFWKPLEHPGDALSPEWVIGLGINAIATAHAARSTVGASLLECVVEIELGRPQRIPIQLDIIGNNFRQRGSIPSHRFVLPRYSFGAFEELGQLVGLIASDCMNAAGVRWEPEACRMIGPTSLLDRMSRGEAII